MKKPKPQIQKVEYVCQECNSKIRRKETEPPPHACNFCHTDNPQFRKVENDG